MENLSGKTVLLGITGGIAAYKMANVASALRKTGAEVHCILTQNATQFITPLTFETLTNNRCIVDTFDRNFQYDVAHVSLAKKADVWVDGQEQLHVTLRDVRTACYQVTDYVYRPERHAMVGSTVLDASGINYVGTTQR